MAESARHVEDHAPGMKARSGADIRDKFWGAITFGRINHVLQVQLSPVTEPNPFLCVFRLALFSLYVKCPKTRFWQLARKQEKATRIVDGTTDIHTHPVLLFSSRSEAEEYAMALGLEPKKVSFRESELFAFWRDVERFEAVSLPEETIQIQKTLSVAPALYFKESIPMRSVVTLPVVDRKKE